jgi:transposase
MPTWPHTNGFAIKACGVGQAQQMGRVERCVGYIKQNFLTGTGSNQPAALNAAARHWLDTLSDLAEQRAVTTKIMIEIGTSRRIGTM